MNSRRSALGMMFAALLVASSPVDAQDPTSRDVAGQLTSLMTEQRLDAFAVQDPMAPDHFLAVLLYTALHQPASAPTRFFLIDLGCNGLRGNDEGVDVLYEKGSTQTLFNGDWKSQDLAKSAYQSKEQAAERQYSRILSHLLAGLRADL